MIYLGLMESYKGGIYLENPVGKLIYKNNLNQWVYGEEFINWLKENSKYFSGQEELSKYLNIYSDLIVKLCKEHNILNFNYVKTNPKFKAIYQDYNWCYQKFFIEGLNHEEMANEANCSLRVIKKWCTEKHRLTGDYRRYNKKLSNLQKDLLIGSMLGDGHIDKREDQPMFIVGHAENQKDYLYYKYNIMIDFCNIKPAYIKSKYSSFGQDKLYKCQPQYRICTRIHECFKDYRGKTYTELLKLINKYSLSIWILDDGHRCDKWDLCVAQYTQNDINFAIHKLKEDFNLTSYQSNSDKRYIKFNADSSRELDKIILDNIPNELDIIKYKILHNDKINNKQKRIIYNNLYLSDYCHDNNLNYKSIMNRIYKGISIENAVNMQVNQVIL